MVYAKCIRASQVVNDIHEFEIRKVTDDNCVYCVGQVTTSKIGQDTLGCVPLNFIYDCLKYGDIIAIIQIEDNESVYMDGNLGNVTIFSKEQKVLGFLNAYAKETIDYIFDEVKNPDIVHEGYKNNFSEELRIYFENKKEEKGYQKQEL